LRHHGVNSASEPQLQNGFVSLAKLDVRRSGPGAARCAYRWQSAWENPTITIIAHRERGSKPAPTTTLEPVYCWRVLLFW